MGGVRGPGDGLTVQKGIDLVIEDCEHLFSLDLGEPFEELVYGRSVPQILEQRGNGHTRSLEDQLTADLFRFPFRNCVKGKLFNYAA
jgi:hypothetical protein